MPARAALRNPGSSSATTTRRATGTPVSASTTMIPDEPAEPVHFPHLRERIAEIFNDAQQSTAGHRKLVVRLRKIQTICCGLEQSERNVSQRDSARRQAGSLIDNVDIDSSQDSEEEFKTEVLRCVIRVLPVKKSESTGDRAVRFVGSFLSSATEKDFQSLAPPVEEIEEFPETATSRLTTTIVSTLVPLMGAKDKVVRFRATQTVAHIVNCLDSIDDELFYLIRQGLVRRIHDKESSVRVQAIAGLTRLAGSGSEESGDDAPILLEKLLEILQNDTSSEVRKTLLLNLPLSKKTLPYLLERSRDTDATIRRTLYARVLPTFGDFRHLSLSMREKLLRWGIRDRDEGVRKAAGRLFYDRWIEDCAASQAKEDAAEDNEGTTASIPALVELLERIDVLNSGAEGGVAHDAMRFFWEGRPDYRDVVTFADQFWANLTPETIFIARSFYEFCHDGGNGKFRDVADEKFPEVTAFAYFLHKYVGALLQNVGQSGPQNGDPEAAAIAEFIVDQLLHICLLLDYSDEVGRRTMYSLMRDILTNADLPEDVTRLVVEVLHQACGPDIKGESEFCAVVLEAVAEVHDTILPEETFDPEKAEKARQRAFSDMDIDMDDEVDEEDDAEAEKPFNKEEAKAKLLREIVVNMKCLHIARCMLQNVEGKLKDNMHLVAMLNNLVVPAVRSHEAPIRERGIECLGLCCLLDKGLAEENMTLFIRCYGKGHEALRDMALRIISDILTAHPTILLPTTQPTDDESTTKLTLQAFHRPLLKAFARALKDISAPTVQATAAVALAKLMLIGSLCPNGPAVTDEIKEFNERAIDGLLSAMVVSFFDPRTRENLPLRQAMTYFFPVYCHSRLSNAQHMVRITVPTLQAVLSSLEECYSLEVNEGSDEDFVDENKGEKETKTLMGGVVGMFSEWTDGRRIVGLDSDTTVTTVRGLAEGPLEHEFLQLLVMKDILERVLGVGEWMSPASKDEGKYLFSLLTKLYIPTAGVEDQEDWKKLAMDVDALLEQAIASKVAGDATSRNGLAKAKNAVAKLLSSNADEDKENDPANNTTMGNNTSVTTEKGGDEEDATVMAQQMEGMNM